MSKILSKTGKKELLERKIGGKKSKIGSALNHRCACCNSIWWQCLYLALTVQCDEQWSLYIIIVLTYEVSHVTLVHVNAEITWLFVKLTQHPC